MKAPTELASWARSRRRRRLLEVLGYLAGFACCVAGSWLVNWLVPHRIGAQVLPDGRLVVFVSQRGRVRQEIQPAGDQETRDATQR